MVPFTEAIKSGFQKAFIFQGRATRAEYWWWALFIWLVILPLIIIPGVLSSTFNVSPIVTDKFYFLLGLWFVIIIVPTIALSVRRLHDIGKSAWYLLVDVIPYVGNFIFTIGRFYNFNFSLASSQNLIKATANVILFLQI